MEHAADGRTAGGQPRPLGCGRRVSRRRLGGPLVAHELAYGGADIVEELHASGELKWKLENALGDAAHAGTVEVAVVA